MSRLVSDIYYNKQNNSDFLLNKVKSIRSLNDSGNKRLKYILSELISNSDTMLKNFKPIKSIKSSKSTQSTQSTQLTQSVQLSYKKNKFGTNGSNSLTYEPKKANMPMIDKNKEYLIQALGINKSKKGAKYNWVDAESSDEDDEDEAKEDVKAEVKAEVKEDEENEENEAKEDEEDEEDEENEAKEDKAKEDVKADVKADVKEDAEGENEDKI